MNNIVDEDGFWESNFWKWMEEKPQRFYNSQGVIIIVLVLFMLSMIANS